MALHSVHAQRREADTVDGSTVCADDVCPAGGCMTRLSHCQTDADDQQQQQQQWPMNENNAIGPSHSAGDAVSSPDRCYLCRLCATIIYTGIVLTQFHFNCPNSGLMAHDKNN